MSYVINASYSASNCQHILREAGNITTKASLSEKLVTHVVDLCAGIVVLAAIGLWFFVI